jgi:hypothetical protein
MKLTSPAGKTWLHLRRLWERFARTSSSSLWRNGLKAFFFRVPSDPFMLPWGDPRLPVLGGPDLSLSRVVPFGGLKAILLSGTDLSRGIPSFGGLRGNAFIFAVGAAFPIDKEDESNKPVPDGGLCEMWSSLCWVESNWGTEEEGCKQNVIRCRNAHSRPNQS